MTRYPSEREPEPSLTDDTSGFLLRTIARQEGTLASLQEMAGKLGEVYGFSQREVNCLVFLAGLRDRGQLDG